MEDHLLSQATKTLRSLAIKMKESNQFGVTRLLSLTPEISVDDVFGEAFVSQPEIKGNNFNTINCGTIFNMHVIRIKRNISVIV